MDRTPFVVIGLAVVSTRHQAADDKSSIDQQQADIRALCSDRGWRLLDMIVLPGQSRNHFNLYDLMEDARANGHDGYDRLWRHLQERSADGLVVVNTDRLGREAVMVELVSRVIRQGKMFIYSLTEGEINETNFRGMSSMAYFKASGENDMRVKRRKDSLRQKNRRGLPTHRPPVSHRIVRDDLGKPVQMVVNETYRHVWPHVYEALIEGISFDDMFIWLETRGITNPKTGQRFAYKWPYRVLLHPIFWGHSSYGRRSDTSEKEWAAGPWCYDPAYAPPPGIEVWHNTHEPVWTGDMADNAIAEMHRRRSLSGSASSRNPTWFAGLFVCDRCGHTLSAQKMPAGRDIDYMIGCHHAYKVQYGTNCTNRRLLREDAAREYIHALIEAAIRVGVVSLQTGSDFNVAEKQVETVDAAILGAERRILALIEARATAVDSAIAYYEKSINDLSQQIERLKAERGQAMNRQLDDARIQAESAGVLRRIDGIGLTAFWQMSNREINQELRRLFGAMRLEVDEGRIVGWR